jgi:competence protein ComEA
MRFRGLYPSGTFLLVLVGTILFLLSREPGYSGWGGRPSTSHHWVRLTAPEADSRFVAIRTGQELGALVERELPRLHESLTDRCLRMPLEGGTDIRIGWLPGSEKRGCVVSPLPERCRYLLGMPLNVNRAQQEEFELLPGIGPRLAGRMIEVRESMGRFSSGRDLLRVPGIGEKLAGKMKGRVCF